MWTALLLLALIAILAAPWAAGFMSQRPKHYTSLPGPAFNPQIHLSGPILCEGVIYGPMGRVTSRFVARFDGQWSGAKGTLTERFHYDSGSVQNRQWSLAVTGDTIAATAPDVVGTGTGTISGPTVQMRYNIRLPVDAGGHVLSVNDWMYLTENGTILNRSQFRKYGVKVAELVATMRPLKE